MSMGDELDDGLLVEDDIVAYSDDGTSDVETFRQGSSERAPTSQVVEEDAASQKKRKRRERAKVQRKKVRQKRLRDD